MCPLTQTQSDTADDTRLQGATDGTQIGNVGDRLKVQSESTLSGVGAAFSFADRTTAALTQVVVERTPYTEQITNAQRSIASSSASDATAGTGARTVNITYLDQTGAGPFTETVTLNGTTYVNTAATNICFIESIVVQTVGSTGSNVGVLTLKAATAGAGVTVWTVAATNNRTFGARHYVALGMTALITGISVSHSGTTVGSGGVFILQAKRLDDTLAPIVQISDFVRLYGQSSTFARTYYSPIRVVGPTRIQCWVTPETTSSTVYRAAFDFSES